MDSIEQRLSPRESVTPDQASQISQAVKTVAIALGKQTQRSEFGAVYGELYRKFGITSYKLMPASRFKESMQFLTEWYRSLTGSDEIPF
ncbi:MAG: ORF6C domain-containing protein [Anaerolineales bacterium]|nr:ORF6C domain-containing protein [Anaerolineales bacterium]